MVITAGWQSAAYADSWTRAAEARNRVLGPATERMLHEARLVPGARVLDIGTGTGDTALLAADLVGPSGHVVATDASPAMLAAATAAVRARGLQHVRVQRLDLAQLEASPTAAAPRAEAVVRPATRSSTERLHHERPAARISSTDSLHDETLAATLSSADRLRDEAPFDAILARNVFMFVPVARVLTGLLPVLRPGGRLAAVVWSALANNPFHRLVLDAARARGPAGEPTPEVVRAFSLGDPTYYARQLAFAGYRDIGVHPVASTRRFASASEALDAIRASPIHSEPILRLPAPKQEAAWSEVEEGLRAFELDGVCEIPLESLVIVGER